MSNSEETMKILPVRLQTKVEFLSELLCSSWEKKLVLKFSLLKITFLFARELFVEIRFVWMNSIRRSEILEDRVSRSKASMICWFVRRCFRRWFRDFRRRPVRFFRSTNERRIWVRNRFLRVTFFSRKIRLEQKKNHSEFFFVEFRFEILLASKEFSSFDNCFHRDFYSKIQEKQTRKDFRFRLRFWEEIILTILIRFRQSFDVGAHVAENFR